MDDASHGHAHEGLNQNAAEQPTAPDDHPEAPRTLGTRLVESHPMPADTATRLLELEAGRHATLTAMRAALGLDLDIDPAIELTWDHNFDGSDALTSDAAMTALLDAMYRAVTSSRLVRVEVTDTAPKATRAAGPIRVRDEEHLTLLVLADNTTDAGVEFSAESHGEGFGGWVEPHRVGSGLLDTGPMPAGSYLMPVLIVAGGKPTTLDMPIEGMPAGELYVRIIDDESGEPVAARVYLSDDVGAAWPVGANIRRDVHGNAWFHADGSFRARIAGTAQLRVTRGIEYDALEATVEVRADGEASLTVRLKRWSHMAADGWYSGDVHAHLHYGGEYLLTPEDASLAQRAEDVDLLHLLVANTGAAKVYDITWFEGASHDLNTSESVLRFGQEYRNDFYGHMCIVGGSTFVEPAYSGFALTPHAHDYPANAVVARRGREAGALLTYAHPIFESIDLDRVFAKKVAYEAKALPVDAALGLIDAVDVLSYPANAAPTAALWYRLLNCGMRLAATAGSDTFMNWCSFYSFSSPPAGVRAFVRVDPPQRYGEEDGSPQRHGGTEGLGGFSTETWCDGVRAGRTFVTNGPMVALSVDGHEIGDEIAVARGAVLRVEAHAGAAVPIERLELIVNGDVVASAAVAADEMHASIEYDLTVDESCWIAARVTGLKHPAVLDADGAYAHTSPIYVIADGAPIARADDAAYFVEWIDRLISMTRAEGRFADDAQRDEVLALFREGQEFYRTIAGEA